MEQFITRSTEANCRPQCGERAPHSSPTRLARRARLVRKAAGDRPKRGPVISRELMSLAERTARRAAGRRALPHRAQQAKHRSEPGTAASRVERSNRGSAASQAAREPDTVASEAP
ncbi:hypothetical protein GCM10020218_004680 [Dactylosporangium vinaceum]